MIGGWWRPWGVERRDGWVGTWSDGKLVKEAFKDFLGLLGMAK